MAFLSQTNPTEPLPNYTWVCLLGVAVHILALHDDVNRLPDTCGIHDEMLLKINHTCCLFHS